MKPGWGENVIRKTSIMLNLIVYWNCPVAGVDSKLNSATGTPLSATLGANMAAGYTTELVPTYNMCHSTTDDQLIKKFKNTTKHKSQSANLSSAACNTRGSKFSPNQTTWGLSSPLQLSHLIKHIL